MQLGRLGGLQRFFNELGQIERCGKQKQGEYGNPGVQQKKRRTDKQNLKKDLTKQGQHLKAAGLDVVRLAVVFGNIPPLRMRFVGGIAVLQNSLKKIPFEHLGAAGHKPGSIPAIQKVEKVFAQ